MLRTSSVDIIELKKKNGEFNAESQKKRVQKVGAVVTNH